MRNPQIIFKELPAPPNPLFKVFYVIENGKSQVMENFRRLSSDSQDEIKTLIYKMATTENFKSDKIRWRLQNKYSYGEIKPRGHRFFFFMKTGKNLIFFRYAEKKNDSLGDSFYKKLESEKRKYEELFEKSVF
jgi:hypothetical protein